MKKIDNKITLVPKFNLGIKAIIIFSCCLLFNKSFSQVGVGSNSSSLSFAQVSDFIGLSNFKGDISLGFGENNAFIFDHPDNPFKMSMGNSAEYAFGPVTGYSIKMGSFSASANEGFTWGISGATPIAALNNQGKMQVSTHAIGGSMQLTSIYSPAILAHKDALHEGGYVNGFAQFDTGDVLASSLPDKHLFFKINNNNILDFYKSNGEYGIDLSNDVSIDSSAYLNFQAGPTYFYMAAKNTPHYLYGPVTTESVKSAVTSFLGQVDVNSGWTWGITGQAPIAAMNPFGEMAVKKEVIAGNAYIKSSVDATSDSVLFGNNMADGSSIAKYALRHFDTGKTSINAPEGKSVNFNISDVLKSELKDTGDLIVYSRLGVGEDNIINGTVLTVDGRMYISDNADEIEKGFTANYLQDNKYKNYLLWVEEGIVTSNLAFSKIEDWPDYVFKADYKLPTLTDVEKFIKTNGHLHTMPSAKTIEADGFALKSMTKNLVQTVEELTLYAIEQDKTINKQNETISNLLDRAAKLQE